MKEYEQSNYEVFVHLIECGLTLTYGGWDVGEQCVDNNKLWH